MHVSALTDGHCVMTYELTGSVCLQGYVACSCTCLQAAPFVRVRVCDKFARTGLFRSDICGVCFNLDHPKKDDTSSSQSVSVCLSFSLSLCGSLAHTQTHRAMCDIRIFFFPFLCKCVQSAPILQRPWVCCSYHLLKIHQ